MAFIISSVMTSLEDFEVDGTVHIEKEQVYFIKGIDLNQLTDAAESIELQEQWVMHGDGGSIRVRLTIPYVDGSLADPKYVLTTKVTNKEDGSKLETEVEITEDLFKSFSVIAASGQRKKRFKVPQDDVVLEFDVFYKDGNLEGDVVEWCKLDVEYTDEKPVEIKIPASYDEIIEDTYPNRDEEMRKFASDLFDKEFTIKK